MKKLMTLVAVGATGAAMAAPAAAQLSPISVHAAFTGTHDVGPCTGSVCTLTADSLVCEVLGVNDKHVPFAGGCTAHLQLQVKTTGTGAARICSGTAAGTFTLSFAGNSITAAATAVVTPAETTWVTQPVAHAAVDAYLGIGSGVVAPSCGVGERTKQTFSGTFSYARVP